MTKNFIRFAVIGLLVTTFATGCSKEDEEESMRGSNSYGKSQATSSNFKAELLSDNVPFTDATNDISGYAWEWEIQRVAGQTALSHFNFIDGFLCDTDEDAGTLRDHIVGAYYSQDGGSTWNYVAVIWGTDNSTVKDGCNGGEVLKINFGGDNIQIRLVMDAEYDRGTQYAIYKRGGGGKKSSVDPCGTIEFIAPGCPKDVCYEYGDDETAWSDGDRYNQQGNWATYTTYSANKVVTLYAGQTIDAGTVTFSSVVNGKVTITISLENGFEFQNVDDNVKIQGYASAPSGNPAPGQFSNKCTDCTTIVVDAADFYGVHLDITKKSIIACP